MVSDSAEKSEAGVNSALETASSPVTASKSVALS